MDVAHFELFHVCLQLDIQLHFKSNLHEILVTYLIFDAEKDPAIREPLYALLFELQYTTEKLGVAGHALNIDFQKFSWRLIQFIWSED